MNIYHFAVAFVANFVYGFPSRKLKVIGVTGTDGKTTTVNLIASILQEAGLKISFLSSINAQIGNEVFDTGLHTTTPSPFLLQRLLKKMVNAGSNFAILEVTSHALDQYRTWGIRFDTAVVTNITPEHLDYHKSYEEYVRAKMRLFEDVEYGVLNIDYQDLATNARTKLIYGLTSKAQFWADQIKEDLKSTTFKAHIPNFTFDVRLNLPGKFNVSNALAAISIAQIYQVRKEQIVTGLARIKLIPGRMEVIQEGQDFLAMVDFAHTPNALRALCEFVRPHISGQLILVFGSAGERDREKRAKMGEIADKYADLVVITREDNRSEKVEKICQEIASGIKNKRFNESFFVIPDRREAIRFALSKARKGDLVVATGKGHEQSLNIDGRETPWDDRKIMREELQKYAAAN